MLPAFHAFFGGWLAHPSNQLRRPHPLRISEGGTRCSQPLEILTLSLGAFGVPQMDRKPARCRPHRFPPSESRREWGSLIQNYAEKNQGQAGRVPPLRSKRGAQCPESNNNALRPTPLSLPS